MTKPSARSVTFDLLTAVLRQKLSLDQALSEHPGIGGLEVRDRGFARSITATTLRRLGQIDALIDIALERPLPRKAQGAHDLLRLGLTQLLFLGTPPHAAVATTVDLAQALGHGPHKSLINAILRRFSREGAGLVKNQDAARINTPNWLWQAWTAAYGEPTCRHIAEAHLTEAPLDITVKGNTLEDKKEWAEKLDARLLPTGSLRRDAGGMVNTLEGFDDGAWWVQDAAAALPVRLFGDVSDKHVIDLCAAPGGKTAQLAAAGARVTAVDRSEKRLLRVRENLDRLGLDADIVCADAGDWRPDKMADAVLVDAPCSSTGTIRRHPDVARLKAPEDVSKLSGVQDRLLAAAVDMVKPGGEIVYCSCSLQPEEGPDRITALLDAGAPVSRVAVQPGDIGGPGKLTEDLISADGALRSLPSHLEEGGGMDGFFAARLKRV